MNRVQPRCEITKGFRLFFVMAFSLRATGLNERSRQHLPCTRTLPLTSSRTGEDLSLGLVVRVGIVTTGRGRCCASGCGPSRRSHRPSSRRTTPTCAGSDAWRATPSTRDGTRISVWPSGQRERGNAVQYDHQRGASRFFDILLHELGSHRIGHNGSDTSKSRNFLVCQEQVLLDSVG